MVEIAIFRAVKVFFDEEWVSKMKNTISKDLFVVDAEGLAELQLGRSPFSLAKEPVSNSFDEESVTKCSVIIEKRGHELAHLSYFDDGKGFAEIKDSWTMYRTTYKRERPDLRGRFNLGEKEILSVANHAVVKSSGWYVEFSKKGREVRKLSKRDWGTLEGGTIIELWINWTQDEVEETVKKLKQINPPEKVTYTVNGERVPTRKIYKTIPDVKLETVLLDKTTVPAVMRHSQRQANVNLYNVYPYSNVLPKDEHPILFELGIPIQEIDCPFHIDVQQKVPMNPNRDTVKDTYLQDLYAETLNAIVDELTEEQVSEKWIRIALEDSRCTGETAKKVRDKRYGEKAVLWSSDTQANERAVAEGWTIIHPKTLSSAEREKFEDAGLKHSSDMFGTPSGGEEILVERTEGMKKIEKFAIELSKKYVELGILPVPVVITFYRSMTDSAAARGDGYSIKFNVFRLGKAWFEREINPDVVGLVIHELAHKGRDPDFAHGPVWQRMFENMIGHLPWIALKDDGLFGWPDDTPDNVEA